MPTSREGRSGGCQIELTDEMLEPTTELQYWSRTRKGSLPGKNGIQGREDVEQARKEQVWLLYKKKMTLPLPCNARSPSFLSLQLWRTLSCTYSLPCLPMVLNPSCVIWLSFAYTSIAMDKDKRSSLSLLLLLLCFLLLSGAARRAESARLFTIINQCKTVIWPAVTPGESFGGGGFALRPGQSVLFTAPVGWSGRIWGRTDCNFDAGGNGSCVTGSCGTALKCGSSGATPASLAEFTLASVDYYDVSLVDGFNLPMVIKPVNGHGNCSAAGCDGDLRLSCPSELAVKANGRTVACRSACDVFDTDQYCCRGLFGNPATCQPTFYSKKFKAACPTAYSYAYDDPTSIFTCADADYVITFCSNRKQSVCSYHNNRLVCSDSSRSWAISMSRLMLVLILSFLALQFSV